MTELIQCAFVGHHTPTPDQTRLAELAGYDLVPVGDFDAFDSPLLADDLFAANMDCRAVSTAHPIIAVEAVARGFVLLSFRNVSRPPLDGKPQFATDGVLVIIPQMIQASREGGFRPARTQWFGDAPQYAPLMDASL